MTPEELMRLAIEKTREGMKAGNSPFGCAIAQENQVIATAHNTVLTTIDSTAHAEVNALRAGCKHTGKFFLEGAIVATTCEPCPMCMAALHWARVDTVYFGAGSRRRGHRLQRAVHRRPKDSVDGRQQSKTDRRRAAGRMPETVPGLRQTADGENLLSFFARRKLRRYVRADSAARREGGHQLHPPRREHRH